MTLSRRKFCAIALSAGGVSIAGCLNTNSQANGSNQTETQDATNASRENTVSHTKIEKTTNTAVDITATRTSGTTLSLIDITASPGEIGDLTIEAQNIKWMGLPNPFDGLSTATTDADHGKPVLDFERMTANPHIEMVLESYPPELQWSSVQRRVTVEIPYRVPEKSPAQEYPYTVAASKSVSGGSDTATKSASFVVVQE